MGWFSRKQPKSLDDALVERTLAFVQEVAEEKPEDEQALLAMIDGIKMMPPKPASTIDAIEAPAKIEAQALPPSEAVTPERILPATLPPIALPSIALPSMLLPSVDLSKVADAPIPAPAFAKDAADAEPRVETAVVTENRPVTETMPARPSAQPVVSPPAVSSSSLLQPALPQSVSRPAAIERARASEPRRPSSAPPQSEMRREIAQRVQNFKAHQQRLNDEREARIKKIYADMQARLEKSGAPKSPPVS